MTDEILIGDEVVSKSGITGIIHSIIGDTCVVLHADFSKSYEMLDKNVSFFIKTPFQKNELAVIKRAFHEFSYKNENRN